MDIALLMFLVVAKVLYIFVLSALAGLLLFCGMLAIGMVLDRLIRDGKDEHCARYRISK